MIRKLEVLVRVLAGYSAGSVWASSGEQGTFGIFLFVAAWLSEVQFRRFLSFPARVALMLVALFAYLFLVAPALGRP